MSIKVEDVNENDMKSNPVQQPTATPKVNDDEVIRKTLETLQSGKPVESIMMDNSNYWEIKGLPSGGRLYPEGTKILGRPLKVIEIKKISSLTAESAEYVINDILKRTIRGIDIDKLYVADKLFLIFWLRANSYKDSSYVVNFVCNKCEKESSYHFNLNNLTVQYLSDEYDATKDTTLPTGNKIKIKFLTIGDTNKVERFKEINRGALGEIDDELLSLAASISEINGQEKGLLEKYNFVLNMSPEDFSYIISYIDKFGMGVKPELNVTCSICGGAAQVVAGFSGSFMLPTYKS